MKCYKICAMDISCPLFERGPGGPLSIGDETGHLSSIVFDLCDHHDASNEPNINQFLKEGLVALLLLATKLDICP